MLPPGYISSKYQVSAIKAILVLIINDGSPMVYMIMNQYLPPLVLLLCPLQCPVYRSRWRPSCFVTQVLWLSLGSPVKGRHPTPLLPKATAAMLHHATAARQHVCSMTCCVASTTPSLLGLQMRRVAALEALLWS